MVNYLITKSGETIECPAGVVHTIVCRMKLKISLTTFLSKRNGIRVKTNGEIIAIEYYGILNVDQKIAIKKILRSGDFYTLIFAHGMIEKERPIRNIEL